MLKAISVNIRQYPWKLEHLAWPAWLLGVLLMAWCYYDPSAFWHLLARPCLFGVLNLFWGIGEFGRMIVGWLALTLLFQQWEKSFGLMGLAITILGFMAVAQLTS